MVINWVSDDDPYNEQVSKKFGFTFELFFDLKWLILSLLKERPQYDQLGVWHTCLVFGLPPSKEQIFSPKFEALHVNESMIRSC